MFSTPHSALILLKNNDGQTLCKVTPTPPPKKKNYSFLDLSKRYTFLQSANYKNQAQ